MKILALETSTLVGSIALIDDNGLICEFTLQVKETHSSQLMPAIDHVLRTAELRPEQLDGFAVALGPGSFTGLRIGLSTAKGLALAASKPLVGISSLEAMAWNLPFCPHLICPMIDARMKEVYAAWFLAKDGKVLRESEDMVTSVSNLLGERKVETVFLGSGAKRYREEISDILGELAHFFSPEIMGARASILGFLALEKLRRGESDDVDTLEPLYIRESQAIEKEKRRIAGR